tara:strand:- start:44 stop:838 length:795 start_codon:yes stop_codon:yes gene_type:complete
MSTAASIAAAASKKAAANAAKAQAKGAAAAAANAAKAAAKATAKSTAEAAAKAAAKAASTAAAAAKPGATAVAKLAAKTAAKNVDELTVAASKAVDEAAAAAGAGAKGSRATALKAAAFLATGGAVAGGLLYIDKKLKDADKEIKDCMKVCLPDNWDDHTYGTLDKSKLKYKVLEDPGEQPVCKETIEDCGKFCDEKCTELHDYEAPGSSLANRTIGGAGNAFWNVYDKLNPFKLMFGDMGGLSWLPCIIFCIIFIVIIFFMMS